MNPWILPTQVTIGANIYHLNTDYRDILEIFSWLDDPELPDFVRWQVAVALFSKEPVESGHIQEMTEYLCHFINGGTTPPQVPGPRLLDWKQDASAIISDMNRVSGQEIRSMPHVHWWTFLSWFHSIDGGQLSTIVSIRDKLRRGKKLEDWEKDYYRQNRERIDIKPRYSAEELAQRKKLEALLRDT